MKRTRYRHWAFRLGCWSVIFSMALATYSCLTPPPPLATPDRETVVLLHGLNRSHRAMTRLAGALSDEGYAVINCDYPSRSADIGTLASNVFARLDPHLAAAPKVHFVTHSLGGILLRHRLQSHAIPNLGRVVMLGPPNGGSEAVDTFAAFDRPFLWVNGPAGCQLGTNGLPGRLAAPGFELGVIAGDRSVNPLLSLVIPGRDDGKVSVARTQVAGMRDFVCLHVTHAFMMRNPDVIRQTCHFLKNGRFIQTGSDEMRR